MRCAASTRYVGHAVYWKAMHELIYDLLDRSRTVVACHTDSPTELYGCAVFEPNGPLHWLYVSGIWRKLGIGKRLLDSLPIERAPITCTFATRFFENRSTIEHYGIEYNPFLLRGLHVEK